MIEYLKFTIHTHWQSLRHTGQTWPWLGWPMGWGWVGFRILYADWVGLGRVQSNMVSCQTALV